MHYRVITKGGEGIIYNLQNNRHCTLKTILSLEQAGLELRRIFLRETFVFTCGRSVTDRQLFLFLTICVFVSFVVCTNIISLCSTAVFLCGTTIFPCRTAVFLCSTAVFPCSTTTFPCNRGGPYQPP